MEQNPVLGKGVAAANGTPAEVKVPRELKKNKRKFSFKVVLGSIGLVIVWFLAVQFFTAERWQMVVNVKAEEGVMGINPLTDSLDFGDLSRELGSTRIVNLKNDSGSERFIMVWKRGEIAEMVTLSQNNFVLKPGEEVKLEFTLRVPPSAEIRQYKGRALVFKWPKLW